MGFTFLHTADWHLGRPYRGFEPETAGILRHARLTVIDRLAAVARAAIARDIVVCGDIFDSSGLPDRVLREAVSRMAAHPDLVWHLLPGNHDPAQANGVWLRLLRFGMPPNIKLLLEPQPQLIAPEVFVLPAPLTSKAASSDPTQWMMQAVTPDGALRIGVAHGSTASFSCSEAPSVAIDAQRRTSAQLDYLALGDWHGTREIAPGVWYSGTPEPEQFPDNEPGYALVVNIKGVGARPEVTRVATAAHLWLKRHIDIKAVADLDPLLVELEALGARRGSVLLELTLTGRVQLAHDLAIAQRLDALEPDLFHLRRKVSDLRFEAVVENLATLSDPQVAAVARKLIALHDASNDAGLAEGALRRLLQLERKVLDASS
jgi:hypothetical protein